MPHRAGLVFRHSVCGRFLLRHGVGRFRWHHDDHVVLRAASRRRARKGACRLHRQSQSESRGRLRLSPDHRQPQRPYARHRPAGRDRPGRALVQDLHDLRPHAVVGRTDSRRDVGGAAGRRAAHGACREPRHHLVARGQDGQAGQRRSALSRDLPYAGVGSRGDQPDHHPGRSGRLPDPHRARVHARRHRDDPPGAGPRPQGVCGDVSAIPVPDRQGHRPARRPWRSVLLLAAAAGRSRAGSVLAGPQGRHAHGVFVGPRAL